MELSPFYFTASGLKQRGKGWGGEITGLEKEQESFIQGLEWINPDHVDGGVKYSAHFKKGG